MEVKLDLLGSDSLKKKLLAIAQKYGQPDQVSVTVGFTQRYAIYVHEVQAKHVVGQWKYLETPARGMTRQTCRTIETALRRGAPMLQALMLAGLGIQRAAQILTPVDTSALKASAFTCPTQDVESVSQAAFQTSEQIRLAQQSTKPNP
jgi:hypothetical protein